jgi:hypothetical protein
MVLRFEGFKVVSEHPDCLDLGISNVMFCYPIIANDVGASVALDGSLDNHKSPSSWNKKKVSCSPQKFVPIGTKQYVDPSGPTDTPISSSDIDSMLMSWSLSPRRIISVIVQLSSICNSLFMNCVEHIGEARLI